MTPTNINETACQANVEKIKVMSYISENGIPFDVTYKLVKLSVPDTMFMMIAESGDESEGVCLGNDEAKSRLIYSLVCEYGVMPGVLGETVKDIEV